MSFRPRRQFIGELKRGAEFQAKLDEAAREIKDKAERETPVGATEDTIHGYVITKTPTTRRVGNTDFFFHLTEFGSVNNPAYAPLRRGVRAAGLRLDEAAKPEE